MLPLKEQDLHDALDVALERAAAKGATSAEAVASTGEGLNVNVRLGELETIEHNRDRGLVVTVYLGSKSGSASTSDYRRGAVVAAVDAACSIASLTEEDPANGLPDLDRLATEFPDLDSYHPVSMSVEACQARAIACEDAARAVDDRIVNSEGASVSVDRGIDILANTLGFRGINRKTRFSTSCSVIGKTDKGMQRDYWYHTCRCLDDLEAPEIIGAQAGRRTVRRLDARRTKTTRVPVLFEAPVAASLVSHLISAISGGALYRKASFLLDHAGKQVFPEFVRIHERPFLPRGMGSASFDNEGVATRARDIVSDGVLRGYVLSSYSARRLGLETTGNAGGVHNLMVDPGTLDFEGLVKEMGTGLLVTELVGFGVNMVTGDYSRGASGFWVENGEIQYPVEELTIAGKLLDIFAGIVAVGSDTDTRGNYHTGSILLNEMTVAGE
ncbi:MAG: metalloprotease PmbA [Proteobacteria bacterium]|nr:MAG: metalloprotease PmbA [Pseudomonadota bacterium]